jgi:hypothetical protein
VTRIPTLVEGGANLPALLNDYDAAVRALNDLADKMRAIEPRIGDYTGETEWRAAVNEHRLRMLVIERLQIEYLEILNGVLDQLTQRDAPALRRDCTWS